jgi:hypothetical protein
MSESNMKQDRMLTTATGLCKHQRRIVDGYVCEARDFGAALKMTEEERRRIGAITIGSIDATPEQTTEWLNQYIPFLFWSGMPDECPKCGHVASGPLTEWTAEQAEEWERKSRDRNEDQSGDDADHGVIATR